MGIMMQMLEILNQELKKMGIGGNLHISNIYLNFYNYYLFIFIILKIF